MGFSEEIKLKVKKKAMFQCCRCHATGVDVHHILPKKDGGGDGIENAAPLCQNCHDQFGDNPYKRRELTQMRDHWYETTERMYSGKTDSLLPLLERINTSLEEIKLSQTKGRWDPTELKSMLKEVSEKGIESLTAGTAPLIAANVVRASTASLSNVSVGELPEITMCMECGEPVVVPRDEDDPPCPHCGEPLWH